MEETIRPNEVTIQRCYAPSRLSEQTLTGIYDRLLQIAAEQHDKQPPPETFVRVQPELTTTTGGPS